jgi:hypothetical protein
VARCIVALGGRRQAEPHKTRDGNLGSGFGSLAGFAPDGCGFGCIFSPVG